MNIEDFSFKQFQEDYKDLTNSIVFVVSGTFMGQPFKETLHKKNIGEGYSKNGILGEIAEIVRKKMAAESGPLEQDALDEMGVAKELLKTAQSVVDALQLDESVGYFVVTLRCLHKFNEGGNYTECPLCGEIVK